jgi:hypothetical protein
LDWEKKVFFCIAYGKNFSIRIKNWARHILTIFDLPLNFPSLIGVNLNSFEVQTLTMEQNKQFIALFFILKGWEIDATRFIFPTDNWPT